MAAWPEETRTETLRLYVEYGTAEASRRTGVPPRTVRDWASQAALSEARDQTLTDAGARLVAQMAETRRELHVRLGDEVLNMLDRLSADDAAPKDVRDLAISFGILFDKLRLESGEATARVENLSQADAELERMAREFAREHSQPD